MADNRHNRNEWVSRPYQLVLSCLRGRVMSYSRKAKLKLLHINLLAYQRRSSLCFFQNALRSNASSVTTWTTPRSKKSWGFKVPSYPQKKAKAPSGKPSAPEMKHSFPFYSGFQVSIPANLQTRSKPSSQWGGPLVVDREVFPLWNTWTIAYLRIGRPRLSANVHQTVYAL